MGAKLRKTPQPHLLSCPHPQSTSRTRLGCVWEAERRWEASRGFSVSRMRPGDRLPLLSLCGEARTCPCTGRALAGAHVGGGQTLGDASGSLHGGKLTDPLGARQESHTPARWRAPGLQCPSRLRLQPRWTQASGPPLQCTRARLTASPGTAWECSLLFSGCLHDPYRWELLWQNHQLAPNLQNNTWAGFCRKLV